jgi:D-alanine-D-alanine ligase
VGYPAFVKPCQGGGSLGAGVVRTEEDLVRRLAAAIDGPYHSYMVEELITGQVCSVGLLEVNGRLTPLPVYEVETQREFIDYVAKHDPRERVEKCPSSLPSLLTVEMQRQALLGHSVIGAYGVSRVDFMVTATNRIVILEVNTLPGLSELGNLATMARAYGMSYVDLIRHILVTAHTRPIGLA